MEGTVKLTDTGRDTLYYSFVKNYFQPGNNIKM